MSEAQNRSEVLAQVKNPLIFFALALLVIEAVLGIVIVNSEMTPAHQFYAFLIMATLFAIVVGLVAVITIWRPSHLYHDVAELKEIIDSAAFSDTIEEAVRARVRADCLIDRPPSQDRLLWIGRLQTLWVKKSHKPFAIRVPPGARPAVSPGIPAYLPRRSMPTSWNIWTISCSRP